WPRSALIARSVVRALWWEPSSGPLPALSVIRLSAGGATDTAAVVFPAVPAMTFDQVRDETLANIDQLVTEAEIVYQELVLPGWGSPDRHGFPRTLYGYVMNAFSIVDLLSVYWEPSEQQQTSRMRRLLVDYLNVPKRQAAIAVQLWRHTLMHT